MEETSFAISFRKGSYDFLKDWVWQELGKHAYEVRGIDPNQEHFSFFIEEKGEFIAGLTGRSFYGSLSIDLLYVTESCRKKGIARALMQKAIAYGEEQRKRFCTVETFDFQALDFYKKLGFFVEFIREGYEGESIFYFLRKELY